MLLISVAFFVNDNDIVDKKIETGEMVEEKVNGKQPVP